MTVGRVVEYSLHIQL